jgi:hypothetical protein
VCPDALATVRTIDANETNRGGVRFAEMHSQVSDRVAVSFDHDDMVSPPLTAPFDPDAVQLIASSSIEMPVVVEAGIVV